VRTNDHRLMKHFVRAGLGYALLPISTMEPGDDDLVAVTTQPALERRVALLQRADRRPPQLVRAFHDFVQERWDAVRRR
jgi:DNA-binding transcriptional LysR family regulator